MVSPSRSHDDSTNGVRTTIFGFSVRASQRPPRHRPGEIFVKGPIPWTWISRAARLPGRSLHVALAIWLLAGMLRKRTVALNGRLLTDMGVGRHSAYRALRALEGDGLLQVGRKPGASPIVTIRPIPYATPARLE